MNSLVFSMACLMLSRRLKAAVLWTLSRGTSNTSAPGAKCVSNSQKDGEEDCLFANFFTPLDATPQSNLPVMLFIHGGSFVNGCGSDYDSSHITSANNVIVVTINYRLGSFGFLQVNDTSANFGFKDQRK